MTTSKLSPDIKEFLERSSTQYFLSAARQFVELLEIKDMAKEIFYSKAHTALLNLYSSGHIFQLIELKYSSIDTDFDQAIIFENKNAKVITELAEEAYYWGVFDPAYIEKGEYPGSDWTITDREATQGWLVDDFADIYRDLKVEILKIETIGTDEAIEEALWQLKWSFAHHWGQHCINALQYLHYLNYEGKQTV